MKTQRYNTINGAFEVISYGNGTAYSITDNATSKNLFVQGDDAVWIESETRDFNDEAILADIFDQLEA